MGSNPNASHCHTLAPEGPPRGGWVLGLPKSSLWCLLKRAVCNASGRSTKSRGCSGIPSFLFLWATSQATNQHRK